MCFNHGWSLVMYWYWIGCKNCCWGHEKLGFYALDFAWVGEGISWGKMWENDGKILWDAIFMC